MTDSKHSVSAFRTVSAAVISLAALVLSAHFFADSPKKLLLLSGGCYLIFWALLYLLLKLKINELSIRFAATTAAVSFSFLVCEIPAVLKLIDYRQVFNTVEAEPWKNPANRLDPKLLHIHKPYCRFTGKQQTGDIAYYMSVPQTNSYPFDIHCDENGFRNPKDFTQADIAVIGDSFIEAATVKDSEMLTHYLSKITGHTVANLGQLWYGPQQEFEVLKRYALKLNPKETVWVFFSGNDLSDYTRYIKAHSNWKVLSKSFHSLRQRSFTKNLIRASYLLLGKRPPKEPAPSCMVPPGKETLYFYDRQKPMDHRDIKTLKSIISILKEAYQLAQANGSHFSVAYIPTKYEVYKDICLKERGFHLNELGQNDLKERLKNGITNSVNEITFIDLTPALKEAAEKGIQVYFSDDTHWTPAGNRTAAKIIAESIASSDQF